MEHCAFVGRIGGFSGEFVLSRKGQGVKKVRATIIKKSHRAGPIPPGKTSEICVRGFRLVTRLSVFPCSDLCCFFRIWQRKRIFLRELQTDFGKYLVAAPLSANSLFGFFSPPAIDCQQLFQCRMGIKVVVLQHGSAYGDNILKRQCPI